MAKRQKDRQYNGQKIDNTMAKSLKMQRRKERRLKDKQ